LPCRSLTPFPSTTPPSPRPHPLSLHDALPIWAAVTARRAGRTDFTSRFLDTTRTAIINASRARWARGESISRCRKKACCCKNPRSEDHTSELQSPCNLVCRLLLEKKKKKSKTE